MIRIIDNNLEDLEGIELNPGKMILETLRTHMSDIYDRITCPEITNILIEFAEQNIPTSESKHLRDAYKDLAPNVEMVTNFTCGNCSFTDELEVPLNAEFFWPK